jgi:hypothetical protein
MLGKEVMMPLLKKPEGMDKEFKLIIDNLNKLGLKTLACCAGHNTGHRRDRQVYLSIAITDDVYVMLDGKTVNVYWDRKFD